MERLTDLIQALKARAQDAGEDLRQVEALRAFTRLTQAYEVTDLVEGLKVRDIPDLIDAVEEAIVNAVADFKEAKDSTPRFPAMVLSKPVTMTADYQAAAAAWLKSMRTLTPIEFEPVSFFVEAK